FGWLVFAKCLSPESGSGLLARRVRVFAASPALVHAHMGTLAEYSLAEADNWRVQFDYGLACLKCMKVEAGLYELTKAGELAGARGEARAFAARLKGLRSGLQSLFTAQPHAECGPGPRTKETWGSQD
ncbi:hypothetical protein LJB81_03670, partial [Desulfovibrio sp. OttesenSCG-928-M14]|nr:hypothetical protein [Desulfovibrio sp. OttesenSCG-928-M14]